MGFKRSSKHGKVYNDDKKTKGSSKNHPGNSDGSTNLKRDSVDVHKEIKKEVAKHGGVQIEDVQWFAGDNEKIRYHLDKYGDVVYQGGFEEALESLGASPVSNSEIKELAGYDEDTDVDEDDFDSDEDQAVYDYLNEKQDDNTYNYSASLAKHLNYGFFEMGDKKFMTFKEHNGTGDVRGGYGDNMLYEISDIDTGATGEPKGDLSEYLNPEMHVTLTYKGEKYDVRKDGGANGFYDIESADGGIDDDTEKKIKGEYSGNLYSAFEEYQDKHGE